MIQSVFKCLVWKISGFCLLWLMKKFHNMILINVNVKPCHIVKITICIVKPPHIQYIHICINTQQINHPPSFTLRKKLTILLRTSASSSLHHHFDDFFSHEINLCFKPNATSLHGYIAGCIMKHCEACAWPSVWAGGTHTSDCRVFINVAMPLCQRFPPGICRRRRSSTNRQQQQNFPHCLALSVNFILVCLLIHYSFLGVREALLRHINTMCLCLLCDTGYRGSV